MRLAETTVNNANITVGEAEEIEKGLSLCLVCVVRNAIIEVNNLE